MIGDADKTPLTFVAINFYRRLYHQPHARTDQFPFLIFGYHDEMNYEIVHSFTDFFNVDTRTEDSKNTHQIFEVQRLFLYSRKISESELHRFMHGDKTNHPEMPLLVVTEIKLNEKILQTQEKLNGATNSLEETMHGTITQLIDNFIKVQAIPHTEYMVFLSLGYSEFVVLFRSDNYQSIVDIINELRDSKYPIHAGSEQNLPFLRSTYSTTGVEYSLIHSLPSHLVDLSLRISFSKSIDLSLVRNLILDALPSDIDKLAFRTTFGKYDLEIQISQIEFKRFVSLFYDYKQDTPKPILDTRASPLNGFVNHTSTRWLLDFKDAPHVFMSDGLEEPNSLNNGFTLPDKYLESPSIRIAYVQMLRRYYEIVMDGASDPILTYELRDVIYGFSKQVQEDRQRIDKMAKGQSIEEAMFLHYQSMGMGMRLITELLHTRIHAFRFFSEVPSHNHQFVRSSTKLFIAYMTLIEEIEAELKELYKELSQANYHTHEINFFAILEYRDKVISFDLFPETEYRIVPISLNLGSFFDLPFNFLLLLHEISHYIPTRDRRARNEVLTKLVCKTIAERVLFMIFTGGDHLLIMNIEFQNIMLNEKFQNCLTEFFMQQLWKGKCINQGSSIRLFPTSLWEQIAESFFLVNDTILQKHKILLQRINRLNQQKEHDPLANFESIVMEQLRIIEHAEDPANLNDQWNKSMDNALETGALGKSECIYLNEAWVDLTETAILRKEQLIADIEEFINQKWFPLIKDLITDLKSTPNLFMIAQLAKHHMNENEGANRKKLAEVIIQFFNSPDLRESLQMRIDQFAQLILETRADFFMCKLLGLRWEHYEWLAEKFENMVAHRSNQDELFELKLRRWILSKTTVFSGENAPVNLEIDELADGMFISDIAKYLDDIHSLDLPNRDFKGKSLQLLNEYYREFTPSNIREKGENGLNEINLIERLWSLGLELFQM